MLINLKTFEDLTASTMLELEKAGISQTPGGIARLFLNVVNKTMAEFYESLSLAHANAFVSTASDDALDAIGALLGCDRQHEEADDAYRYRITKQVLSSASANETSIRLAALNVEGVSDVVLKRYALGTGSFMLLVVTDDNQTKSSILDAVVQAIDEKVGYGIKYVVAGPTLKEVELSLKLILKDSTNDARSQEIKMEVRDVIYDWMAKKTIAESMVLDDLTKTILNVSPQIVTYSIERFKIDGQPVSYVSQDCNWNERFVISSNPDAIIIA